MITRPPPHALNRRAVPRKVLRQLAWVVQGDAETQVRTWDLGTDGMCLLTPRPIAPGSRIDVSFEVPLQGEAHAVTVTVKVVFSSYSGPEGFKIGTVFTHLGSEATGIIREFAISG
jgi:hypothetical protein